MSRSGLANIIAAGSHWADGSKEGGMKRRADDQVIYLAEDDIAVCRSLALLLQSYGWQVQTFADGEQCLAAALAREPAAIVADLRMPMLGAIGLYHALVDRGLSIPFVILTAYQDDRERHERLPEGIVEFLEKPCDGAALDVAIRRVAANTSRLVGR